MVTKASFASGLVQFGLVVDEIQPAQGTGSCATLGMGNSAARHQKQGGTVANETRGKYLQLSLGTLGQILQGCKADGLGSAPRHEAHAKCQLSQLTA